MSYLIFCSFEVGGLPYKMAEALNRHGIKTYYISLAWRNHSHDSTVFHYGDIKQDWDLSSYFSSRFWSSKKDVELLRRIKIEYNIDCCLALGHKAYLLREAGMGYSYLSYGFDLDQCCKVLIFPKGMLFWKERATYFNSILNFYMDMRRLIPKEYAFLKKFKVYLYILLNFCGEQKRSVLNSVSLMILSYQEKFYKQLCPHKRLFFLPSLTQVTEYEQLCKEKIRSKKMVCETINADNFLFSAARQFWYGKNSFFEDNKGNDIIFYSFARYLEISGDRKSKLILGIKGPDVEQSRKLAGLLGISDYIIWVKEMRRDELGVYYKGASACLGQFGTPALAYAVLEPLSNATSCASFAGDNDAHVPFYKSMPPIFNSKDPCEIGKFMHKIISDAEYASKMSYESWLWAKNNCSEERFVESFVGEMSLQNNESMKKDG